VASELRNRQIDMHDPEDNASINTQNGSPAAFFALTFLLSVPIYALATLAYLNVVGGPEMGPMSTLDLSRDGPNENKPDTIPQWRKNLRHQI
jgi:hypothetical protein